MSRGFAEIPTVNWTGNEIWTGNFAEVQAQAALQHGPIYTWPIRSGPEAGRDFVFMTGPEANRFVLHTHRDHFSHDRGWTPVIGPMMGKGLLNMDDPEHARHRKMWNPAFTSARMEAYVPVIHRIVTERTQTWVAQPEVDVYAEAREITFDAAAAALAGFTPGPQVDRLRQLFYIMLYGAGADVDETYEAYWQRAFNARTELTQMLLRLIAERRQQPADRSRDVLGMIVHARDENGQQLNDQQVLAHLNILLVAGHETTTTLSAWVLYLLATQPEQRARVAAELRTLLGDAEGPPPVEALRAMKTLDNFVKEAGRLYSPVLNVPRGVVKDFEFGGYHVPAGTQLRLALAAGHRLPDVFADPTRFDPDRFAPPREEDKQRQYSLVTFGGGSRICIGINFASIEVKTLVAHGLRTYEWSPVSEQPPMHIGHWTATIPGGIRMRVRRT